MSEEKKGWTKRNMKSKWYADRYCSNIESTHSYSLTWNGFLFSSIFFLCSFLFAGFFLFSFLKNSFHYAALLLLAHCVLVLTSTTITSNVATKLFLLHQLKHHAMSRKLNLPTTPHIREHQKIIGITNTEKKMNDQKSGEWTVSGGDGVWLRYREWQQKSWSPSWMTKRQPLYIYASVLKFTF